VMGEFAEINGSTCIFKSGNGPSSEEGISWAKCWSKRND
jgi:hypothetical protein